MHVYHKRNEITKTNNHNIIVMQLSKFLLASLSLIHTAGAHNLQRTYSIKCGTDTFMCGDGLTEHTVYSNPGTNHNGAYISKSLGECKGMIDVIKSSSNPFGEKCPNGKGISHYVEYDGCNVGYGTKFDSSGESRCSCPSGKCGPPKCGGTIGGDPHFRTHDGTLFSFHGECDMVMARSPSFGSGLGLDVHARTTIMDGSWSLVSNAAIRIGNDIFEVVNDGSYFLNGIPNATLPFHLAGRYEIKKVDENINDNIRTWYTIGLDNGDKIKIASFKLMLSLNVNAKLEDASGMLGSSSNLGMIHRDGETVIEDAHEMGHHWQVHDNEPMLFHDIRAPQYPARCIMPEAEAPFRRLRTQAAAKNYRRAKEACEGLSGTRYEFCMHDVIQSGDTDAAYLYRDFF